MLGYTELVEQLAEITQTPRTRVHLILDALALLAGDELGQGRRVRIKGLGILSAKDTPARTGQGPNGQPYSVPARRRVVLRADQALTRAVEVVVETPEAAP
jgi:DNA-binding protein HU-beta